MSAQLLGVKMQNFKVHEALDLEFGPGITVIVGPNGSGKTSGAQAISWCFWGSDGVPAKQQKRLIRHGADFCFVEVPIELDGEGHVFSRRLTRSGTTTAKVMKGDEVVADSSSGVRQYLESRGLDLEGFSIQYAAQKELDFFVFAIPSVRKKLVASLFRLEPLDDVVKAVRRVHDRYAQQCAQAPTAEMVESYVTSASGALNTLDGLTKEAGELAIERDRQTLQVEKLRAAFSGEAVRERAALEADVTRFADVVEEAGMLAAALVIPEAPDPKELPDLAGIEAELVTANDHMRELVADFSALGARRKFLADNRGELEAGECPLCLRGIRSKEKALASVDAELANLDRQCEEAEAAATAANKVAFLLAADEANLRDQLREADRLHQAAESAQFRKKELGDKQARYQVKLTAASHELEKLPPVNETAEGDLRNAERQLDTATQAHGLARGRITVAERAVDEATLKLDAAEKALQRADRLRVKRDRLQTLAKALPDFRDSVMAASLGWVADRATRLLYGATGRDWRLSINDDLEFSINDHPLADFSTGQVDTVCVCLRIAIAEYLSQRIGFGNLMILDGVLDRIDEDNRDALGLLLGEINVDQVLVLSHFDLDILDGERIEIGSEVETR